MNPTILTLAASKYKGVYLRNNTQTASFVGLAVRLVVWTPLLILTPTCVDISQVVKNL